MIIPENKNHQQNTHSLGDAINVIHFIRSVNPALGGPIQGIKSLTEAAQGSLVTKIVSLDDPNDTWVKECPIPVIAVGPGFGTYGFSFLALKRLKKRIKSTDIIIVNGIWQYSSILGMRFAKFLGTPMYVFTHGMLDPWFKKQYPLKHIKKTLYWAIGDYQVLKHATAVIFTTQLECELARQSFPWRYQVKEFVLGYGCNTPPEFIPKMEESFFQACPKSKDKKVLLYLSRIHEKKGCDLALKAFHKVFANSADYHLVMAGPCHDNLLEKLQKLATELGIADRIEWPGMLSGDSKWGAFYTSHAYCLPSHQENFGIAIAEALSTGIPVLTTNKVNLYQEIIATNSGIISDDTESGIIEAFEKLHLQDIESYKTMKQNAKNCFDKHFNFKTVKDDFIKKIQSDQFQKSFNKQ